MQPKIMVYKVVAINKGKVVETVRVFGTLKAALDKLRDMNNRFYKNLLNDSFAVVAERAIVVE